MLVDIEYTDMWGWIVAVGSNIKYGLNTYDEAKAWADAEVECQVCEGIGDWN